MILNVGVTGGFSWGFFALGVCSKPNLWLRSTSGVRKEKLWLNASLAGRIICFPLSQAQNDAKEEFGECLLSFLWWSDEHPVLVEGWGQLRDQLSTGSGIRATEPGDNLG